MNEREQAAYKALELLGAKVYRNGWPDFLIEHEGRIAAVEHKSPGDVIRPEQAALHEALRAVMPVFVIRTSGLSADGGFFFLPDGMADLAQWLRRRAGGVEERGA